MLLRAKRSSILVIWTSCLGTVQHSVANLMPLYRQSAARQQNCGVVCNQREGLSGVDGVEGMQWSTV
jgi:hypothetical protein